MSVLPDRKSDELAPRPDVAALRQPRQARSREKHQRMMDAGERLFAERGYDRTRVADIARAAGCAVGTFYHRFHDKDVFFRALQVRFCDRGRAASDAFFSADTIRDKGAQELVTLFVEGTVLGIQSNAEFLRAITLRLGEAPDLRGPMQKMVRYMTEKLTNALLERADEVGHPEPRLAVPVASQFMMGTLLNIILNNPGPLFIDDPRLSVELTRMFLAYLRIKPRYSYPQSR